MESQNKSYLVNNQIGVYYEMVMTKKELCPKWSKVNPFLISRIR